MRDIFRSLTVLLALTFSSIETSANQRCARPIDVGKFDSTPCKSSSCEREVSIVIGADHWCTGFLVVKFSVSILYKNEGNALNHIKEQWKYNIRSQGEITKNVLVPLPQGSSLFDVLVSKPNCSCGSE